MHEASLISELFQIAFEQMQNAGATRILRVNLRLGLMSGAVPEALQFAFDALKVGTPARDATLEIDIEPLILECESCGLEFGTEDVFALCPNCEHHRTRVISGRDLRLLSLELSTESDPIDEALG